MYLASINKYIIPIVTQSIYNKLIETPGDYTTLIETFIKPCIAFYVKYLHTYQLSLDAGITQVEFLKNLAAEVLAIAQDKEVLLLNYVTATYFPPITPIPTTKTLKNGFLL
ncbi:MAG: hypothetical protein ACOYKE_13155 [Ferruginibacter sp.]